MIRVISIKSTLLEVKHGRPRDSSRGTWHSVGHYGTIIMYD